MAKEVKSNYKISDIYQGGYSSFDAPNSYGAAGKLGMTTDPRTANVIQEVSTKLSSGAKHIDVTAVSPDVFDSMPKQHLKEVNRLAKLTGVDISMHGPVIDVSGIDPRGGGYSDAERKVAERKVAEALIRAHDLNPDGNIHVNFHTSEGLAGSELLPPHERTKQTGEYRRLIAINKESGRMAPLEPETKYYPDMKEINPETVEKLKARKITEEEINRNREKHFKEIPLEKGKYYSPIKRLRELNASEWENSLNQVFFNQERVGEILGKNGVQIAHVLDSINKMKEQKVSNDKIMQMLNPDEKIGYTSYLTAQNYLQDIHQQVNGFFSKAYEFGTPEQKHTLKKMGQEFSKALEKTGNNPFAQAQAMRELTNELRHIAPEMWVPLEKFQTGKTAETFGNAAFEAYKKFKNKAPVLVIENPPATHALSKGKDVRNVVEESRKKFIQNAVAEGMSESQAKKEAEKLIGATWDVGHINMLRRFGFKEEDITKEAEHVAPVLKMVHLSDNFGFEHTELPMGMGNVPLKEVMEKLGEKGFEAKKIVEAGHWWNHFRTPPFQESLEGMGSPIYSMKMAPYWNQSLGFYQGYLSGMEGNWLPQINYETFGTSFSRLPKELGGSTQGTQGSRMSGRPME